MNLYPMYKRIMLDCPITQKEFVAGFNDTVETLCAIYGEKHVCGISAASPCTDIYSQSTVLGLYADAILDNIRYLKTKNNDRRVDFLAKAEYAYKTLSRNAPAVRVMRRESF